MRSSAILKGLLIVFLIISASGSSVTAICGDQDGSSTFDVADLTYLIDWWFLGGPKPLDFTQADVDDYELITIRDIHFMIHDLYMVPPGGTGWMSCPPTKAKLIPTVTANTNISTKPNNFTGTSCLVTVEFKSTMSLKGAVIPIQFTVDGTTIPTISSVTVSPNPPFSLFDQAKVGKVDNNTGVACFIFSSWNYTYNTNAKSTVGTVMLTVPTGGNHSIKTTDASIGPKQPDAAGQDVFYPMLLATIPKSAAAPDVVAFTPNLTCCQVPGDANHDGTVNISDLTYYVDFMFTGGPPPPCFYESDFDGNCEQSISDITYFVDYMFSSGLPPFDCHLCD